MAKKSKSIRVKLVANPGAGKTSDTANNLKLVTGYLEKNGFQADIALAKSKEKITQITQRAVKKGYKIVIAMGGDGTVKAVMRGLAGSKVRLGILPVGIENNIAMSLGIPNNLEEACAIIAADNTQKLDLGQVKTSESKKSVFFEMVTLGLSASVYPDVNKIVKGKLSESKNAVSTPAPQETKPKSFLTLDDEPEMEVETLLVMVSKQPCFGKNNLLTPADIPSESNLDVAVFPDFSKTEILRYFAAISDRGYTGKGKIQHYQAKKLKIKISPKLDVMVDGVAIGKGTVSIKLLKNTVRVITTQKNPAKEGLHKDMAEVVPETQAEPLPQLRKKSINRK
jgi:YegS/Rv2252/BmrU family lipid kinase